MNESPHGYDARATSPPSAPMAWTVVLLAYPNRLYPSARSKYLIGNPVAENFALVAASNVPYTSIENRSPSASCRATNSTNGGFSR